MAHRMFRNGTCQYLAVAVLIAATSVLIASASLAFAAPPSEFPPPPPESQIEGNVTSPDVLVNVGDAVAIKRYTMSLLEFDADQLKAGDTNDDGLVNVGDAVHIMQYTVDPYMQYGVLKKPLWDFEKDGDLWDPLLSNAG